MCPWVGPHAPSFGRQLWGLHSRVEYLSPQGVLLPLVYGTTASLLWLELRGLSAWQATPSWAVYQLAHQRLLPWLRVTFAMVPDAAWPGSDQWPWGTAPASGPVGRLGRPSASDPWGVVSFLSLAPYVRTCVRCPGPLGSCLPVCPLCALFCLCGVLSHLAPVHRCARSVRFFACAVSWAPWLLFTGVTAGCVALRVRRLGPTGSCSPVCPCGLLCCVCGVLGHMAPVHRCARSVCCVSCAVSWATWLLFTGVPVWFVVLRVRCPGPLGSCSLVCPLGVLCCVCDVPGHLAPVHRCARVVCCVACAVSWPTWLLFTGVPVWFVVLRVRCPGPLGACSPVCPLGVLCCLCSVLGHLALVHRCARSLCCFACAVSWATWLLFTGVPARFVALRVRCPGPLGSFSLVCPRGSFSVACAVSPANWLLFTSVPARCALLGVRCPGPLGSCSPVRLLGLSCCLCGVLGPLTPVHRCVRSVCCPPGPLGSCSPVCPLCLLLSVRSVLGHLAAVHRCARSVWYVACAVSWANSLLFTGVPARCALLGLQCPRVRFSYNLYSRFFQCKILIYVHPQKTTIPALFWTVLVSVDQEFL